MTVALGQREANAPVWAERLAWLLLLALVFTVPWEKSLWVEGVGTITRAMGMLAFGAGAVVVLLRRRLRSGNVVMLLAALFVAWSACTWAWSVDAWATRSRVWTLAQLLAMLWLVWELCRSVARQQQILAVYVCGALAGAGITFTRYLQDIETYYRRYAATGFDPNDFGLVMVLSLPMALYLGLRTKSAWRWFWYLAALVVIAAVLLTASRTGFRAMIVALTFGFWTWRQATRWQRVAAMLPLLFLAASFIQVAPAPSRNRLATIPNEITKGTLNSRKQIWKSGARVWLEHPVFGIGAGAYPRAVEPELGKPPIAGFQYVAHNTFLSVLVETGLLGAGIYGLLLIAVALFIWMLPMPERALWGVMLAVWCTGVMTLTWEHYKGTWLLMALVSTEWAIRVWPPSRQAARGEEREAA